MRHVDAHLAIAASAAEDRHHDRDKCGDDRHRKAGPEQEWPRAGCVDPRLRRAPHSSNGGAVCSACWPSERSSASGSVPERGSSMTCIDSIHCRRRRFQRSLTPACRSRRYAHDLGRLVERQFVMEHERDDFALPARQCGECFLQMRSQLGAVDSSVGSSSIDARSSASSSLMVLRPSHQFRRRSCAAVWRMTANNQVRNADRPPYVALPSRTFTYTDCSTFSASTAFHPQQLNAHA